MPTGSAATTGAAEPLVSVVMPAYNAATTVVEAARSALEQTHRNLELLLIDDGSLDATASLVEAMNEPRVTVLRREHQGVSAARNEGIRRSAGEYIAFLDADDLWLEHKLEAQLKALEAAPQAAVAYGLLDRIDASGRHRLPLTRQVENGDLSELLLVWNVVGNGSNLLVRRSVFDDVGGFNESLEAAEDWQFSVRLAQRFEFVCVPQVLGLYRQRSSSASADLDKMERSFLRAWKGLEQGSDGRIRQHKRRSLAVHYHYLTTRSLDSAHTRREALRGLRYLGRCLVGMASDRELRHRMGVNRRFATVCARRLLRPSDPARWSARDELERTGLIHQARALDDPSVIADLISEEQTFAEAIAKLRREGHHHRVPYLVTPGIARVAFDRNLVALVEEVLGEQTPWVMWGANIRVDIPNAANHWHTDIESHHWPSLTVVVGLSGCDEGNATKYIPYSQNLKHEPPEGCEYVDAGVALEAAQREGPGCTQVKTFDAFGNGRFYAFDAKGWHCGDPATAEGRVMLFLHYQRADAPRVPHMKDWIEGTWLDEPAPYLSSFDRAQGSEVRLEPQAHPSVNARLARAPRPYAEQRGGVLQRLRRVISV